MEWLITHLVAAWLLPPGNLLLVAAAGAAVALRRPRMGRALLAVSLIGLYALSTWILSHALAGALEPAAPDPVSDRSGEAVVVLGGGSYFAAPEYGGDTVSFRTLVRVRYGAHLHRALGLPLLVAGGTPRGNAVSEAHQMKEVLERDFGVPVRWVEQASSNTLQNARLARGLLEKEGVHRIYLVTHALHMPRARLAFEHAGFSVIPAPTGYTTRDGPAVLDWLPDADALARSSEFFHELIGIGWYHLRFAIDR